MAARGSGVRELCAAGPLGFCGVLQNLSYGVVGGSR
ncbi:hypothetical protein OK074_8138 [Actinobacteria bacterium OK074]|nr:hypothetical protein OK074_8138 [Actinobacteria bacterium OK074]